MQLPKLLDIVKGTAHFTRYEDKTLYYRVIWEGESIVPTGTGSFDFPIPIDDAGGGTFLPVDKGIRFQRWIRKHLEYLQKAADEAGG